MTLKKQFSFFATLIITIPIICFCYILLERHFRSSNRLLIEGTNKISKFDKKALSKKDSKELFQSLKLLPPDVQACVTTEDNTVIFSSIPDLDLGTTLNQDEAWQYIKNSYGMYFYQFTSLYFQSSKVNILTRIPRFKQKPLKHKDTTLIVLFLFTIISVICVVFIILISRTIFKSIIKIEETTQEIANGNLLIHIKDSIPNTKQNEITSILDSIEKMRIALLEEQDRKNRFIMGLSHDLRTPVAIIKGYTEAISDSVIPQNELPETIKLIHSKANQLEDMINTLINFVKLNKEEIKDRMTPTSINKIIESYANEILISGNIFKREIHTNINIPEEIIIPLDEQLVHRSLENLFSNAVRYTKDYDVIEFNSYTKDHKLYIEMKDTGIGIAKKDLKYIFDIFYRGTNSRKESGMGIGLSVVKNIISTHGWDITVTSEKNSGTCFTIIINY